MMFLTGRLDTSELSVFQLSELLKHKLGIETLVFRIAMARLLTFIGCRTEADDLNPFAEIPILTKEDTDRFYGKDK